MKDVKRLTMIALTLLVGACSDNGGQAERPPVRDNIVWGEQVRSLEKAQQVEGMVLEGAEQRRRMIEAQTQ